MTEADEILALLEEGEQLERQLNVVESELDRVVDGTNKELLREEFLAQVVSDVEEDSVESLLRAEERLSALIRARIQEKLDGVS